MARLVRNCGGSSRAHELAIDEAFVTPTSFCICPVSSVNGAEIADGTAPGRVTNRLMNAYRGLFGMACLSLRSAPRLRMCAVYP